MKKTLFIFLLFLGGSGFSQVSIDSLKESIDEHKMKISAFDERISTIESSIDKLSRIKLSGYIQAQYEYYQFSPELTPNNTFYLRRARIKFSYEGKNGLAFVLQPDFATNNLALKDAYVTLNDKWLKMFSLTAGQFNRLNYEVEYSSSQREVLERSKVIKYLYPGEREIGAKLEIKPKQIPIKFQLAAFNGNFSGNSAKDGKDGKDNDNEKDYMARAI